MRVVAHRSAVRWCGCCDTGTVRRHAGRPVTWVSTTRRIEDTIRRTIEWFRAKGPTPARGSIDRLDASTARTTSLGMALRLAALIWGLLGHGRGGRAFAIAGLADQLGDMLLVVVPGERDAEELADDIALFLEDVTLAPAWETLPFEHVSPNIATMARRAAARHRLAREGALRWWWPAFAVRSSVSARRT